MSLYMGFISDFARKAVQGEARKATFRESPTDRGQGRRLWREVFGTSVPLFVFACLLIAGWFCRDCFLERPSIVNSHSDVRSGDSECFYLWSSRPSLNSICNSFVGDLLRPMESTLSASIFGLLRSCCPSAVLSTIALVVVDPVDAVFGGRSSSHVLEEFSEGVKPSLRHSYSSTPVVFVVGGFLVVTTNFDIAPCFVFHREKDAEISCRGDTIRREDHDAPFLRFDSGMRGGTNSPHSLIIAQSEGI